MNTRWGVVWNKVTWLYSSLTFPEQSSAAPVWTSSLLSHSHCVVPVLPTAAVWCPAPPVEVKELPNTLQTFTGCWSKSYILHYSFLPAAVLAFWVLISQFCILRIFQTDQRTWIYQKKKKQFNHMHSIWLCSNLEVVNIEMTHMGLRTSIFIFCFGVRSPCRMTAMTQRSSILECKLTPAWAMRVISAFCIISTQEATFVWPFQSQIHRSYHHRQSNLSHECMSLILCYDSHGPWSGGNNGDVLSLSRDGPGDLKLWSQLTHHDVPGEPKSGQEVR